jgi:hypothetical protein
MATAFKCSQDTKTRIELYEQANQAFKEAWERFETNHELELAHIEQLRDDRNAKLDEAKRSIRAELETVDAMRVTSTEGPFRIQKKWSDFYIPEKLASMLYDHGLYDLALSSGIVTIKMETAPYEEVRRFLEIHGIDRAFECCEDGEEASSAIGGPKQIPPLGAELKKE